jgi:hypothetical protein
LHLPSPARTKLLFCYAPQQKSLARQGFFVVAHQGFERQCLQVLPELPCVQRKVAEPLTNKALSSNIAASLADRLLSPGAQTIKKLKAQYP